MLATRKSMAKVPLPPEEAGFPPGFSLFLTFLLYMP